MKLVCIFIGVFFSLAVAQDQTNSTETALSTLTATADSPSSINLTWTKESPPDATFQVWRKQSGDTEWAFVGTAPAGAESFESGGLLADTTYDHLVSAVDKTGERYSAVIGAATPSGSTANRGAVIAPAGPEDGLEDTGDEAPLAGFRGVGSIAVLDESNLVLAYAAAPSNADDFSRNGVVLRTSADGGTSWSEEREAVNLLDAEGNLSASKPSITRMSDGRLGMSYLVLDYDEMWEEIEGSYVEFRSSADKGHTWSEAVRVTDDLSGRYSQRNDALIVGDDARLLLATMPQIDRLYQTAVYTSDDHGTSWTRRAVLEGPNGCWEPSIVQVEGATDFLVCRTRQENGWIYGSRSSDNGETWTEPQSINVHSVNSPAVVDRIPGTSTVVLLYHPRFPIADNGDRRRMLATMTSTDGGYTFDNYRQVEYNTEELWAYQNPSLDFSNDYAHLFYSAAPRSDGWGDGYYLRLPLDFFTSTGPWPY